MINVARAAGREPPRFGRGPGPRPRAPVPAGRRPGPGGRRPAGGRWPSGRRGACRRPQQQVHAGGQRQHRGGLRPWSRSMVHMRRSSLTTSPCQPRSRCSRPSIVAGDSMAGYQTLSRRLKTCAVMSVGRIKTVASPLRLAAGPAGGVRPLSCQAYSRSATHARFVDWSRFPSCDIQPESTSSCAARSSSASMTVAQSCACPCQPRRARKTCR